jgi:hypothetical protein
VSTIVGHANAHTMVYGTVVSVQANHSQLTRPLLLARIVRAEDAVPDQQSNRIVLRPAF